MGSGGHRAAGKSGGDGGQQFASEEAVLAGFGFLSCLFF
jgi:hypothetical protein